MSLEQTLERIAVALEEGNRLRLAEMASKVKPIADAVEEALAEAEVTTTEPEEEPETQEEPKDAQMDRSELLVKCGKLGITVPHGTRTTTLVKWIAKAEAEKAEAEKAEAEKAEAEKAEVPSDFVEVDPFEGDDASDELSQVIDKAKEEDAEPIADVSTVEEVIRPKTGEEVIQWFKDFFGYSKEEIEDFKKAFEPEKHIDEKGNKIPFSKLSEAELLDVFDKYYKLRGSENCYSMQGNKNA